MATPKLAAKALRLAATVRPEGGGWRVQGDHGEYQVAHRWGRWQCRCDAHITECSHVLAVQEYLRREKEQKMAQEQTKITPVQPPNPQAVGMSLFPSQWEWQCMREQAELLVATGFLPAGVKAPEQAIAIMLKGRELTIPPMEALSQLYVVQGKVTLQAQLMLGLIRRSNRYGYKILESSNSRCIVEMWPYAHPEEKFTSTFTIQDAKTAGLANKGPWTQYPAQMLRARAISAAARVVCPEIIGGLYTPEELGAEVAINAEGEVEVVGEPQATVTPAAPAPAPAHNSDTGEIIEGDFEAEPDDAGAEEPKFDADGNPENAAAQAFAAEVAAQEAAQATQRPQNGASGPAPAESNATPPPDTEKAAEAPKSGGRRRPPSRRRSAAADAPAAAPAAAAPAVDWNAEDGNQGARLDEPIDPFGDTDDDGAEVQEQAEAEQVAAGIAEPVDEPSTEEAAAWVEVWASADGAVSGETVPEDLAAIIANPGPWRMYLMRACGATFAQQEALCRRFGLPDPAGTDAAQRLAIIWWLERQQQGAQS